MGMYDCVRSEFPLPHDFMQGREFQTKSFECEMAHYTITADGQLVRTYEGWFGNDNAPCDPTPILYHGDLFMYDFAREPIIGLDGKVDNGLFIEYQVRFTEGRLQWVKDVTVYPANQEKNIKEGES